VLLAVGYLKKAAFGEPGVKMHGRPGKRSGFLSALGNKADVEIEILRATIPFVRNL
jgi:hypothetical protein